MQFYHFILFGIILGIPSMGINWQYEYPGWSKTVNITGSPITFERTPNMILKSMGVDNKIDFFKALGYSHVHDRYVQMCIFRLASQGLLTKYLPYRDSLYKDDIKSNQMNLKQSSEDNAKLLSPRFLEQMNAYLDGINTYLENQPRPIPLEFIILNYTPEPFTVVDVLTMYKHLSYASFNDICLNVEKAILEVLRDTDNVELLKMSFAPHLENITSDLVEIYRSLKDLRPLYDQKIENAPKMTNSNNWAVSGKLSKSGFPIMGSDPHMGISRLPNPFYESQYEGGDGLKVFGITIPGLPVMAMGRNNNLAFSLTFGMLDMSDYFIENIEGLSYERDGEFHPLIVRNVEIASKIHYFYHTSEGHVIERSLDKITEPLTSGRYLAARFALPVHVDTELMHQWLDMPVTAKTVYEAVAVTSSTMLGTNYVFADNNGNIAYQQGGVVPIRTVGNGLLPLPAWNSENLWSGYLKGEDYMSIVNPPEGYVATANNHIQDPNKPVVTTFAASEHRIGRIRHLLASKDKFTPDDFKRFQSDTLSLLAAQIVPLVTPYLGSSDIEEALKSWDFVTTCDSKPAAFFDILYRNLQRNILLQFFDQERAVKYGYFFFSKVVNEIVESHNSSLLKPGAITTAVIESLEQYNGATYCEVNRIYFHHRIFGNKLSDWFGLDVINVPTNGFCRGCVKQSQAWRMVTDLGTDIVESVLPGGPSGNFLSNLYATEIDMFIADQYKRTEL